MFYFLSDYTDYILLNEISKKKNDWNPFLFKTESNVKTGKKIQMSYFNQG